MEGSWLRMITVKLKQSWNDADILIEGHAGYAERGKDIVCASMSTLYQNLVNSIDQLSDSIVHEFTEENSTRIHIGGLYEYSRALVDSFKLGCQSLAMTYPNNVEYIDVQSYME